MNIGHVFLSFSSRRLAAVILASVVGAPNALALPDAGVES
jgi:hypothetical protein